MSEVPRAIEDIKLKRKIYNGEIIEKDIETLSSKEVGRQIEIEYSKLYFIIDFSY